MATGKKSILREGFLLKRQRGQSMNTDLRKLKFQQRFIQLSQSKLEYRSGRDGKNRGQYSVKEITIVEKVPDVTFGKYFCFQIGNEREVMYFSAKSEKERDAWIEAFRIAASLNSNTMLSHYHTGAYGQVDQSKWSCCGATKRESPGCQKRARHAHRERASTTTSGISNHDQEILSKRSRSKSNEFHSQSVPARYFYQDKKDLESSQFHSTLVEEDYSQTAESPTELDPHGKQLGRMYRYDAQSVKSVDSGLGRYESTTSLGVGEGLSPHTYRKRLQRKQKGIESNSELSLNSIISEPSTGNWTLLRSIQMDKSTSIVKAVFRNAEMLVTAYMDEKNCVNIATANVSNPEEDGNVYKTVKSIGSIDTWRKYLALGSPKLQLIDTTEWTWAKTLVNGGKPHYCAFRPDGSLVSAAYDSPVINVWPPVHSLCSESSDDVVDEIKPKAQLCINSIAHMISSLSVSSNRNEPWLAVGLRATDSDSSPRVYIFDCDQNQQVWEQQLDTSSHESQARSQHVADVHTSFSHDGRQLAVGCGNHFRVFRPKSQELVFSYPFPDGIVTSLSYSPTSSYLSVGLSSGQVKIFGEPLTSSTSKQFTLPMFKTPVTAVTSLTYSKDCQTLGVGYNDGALIMWKIPCKSSRGIKLKLIRTGTLTVDSESSVTCVLKDDAITLSVPKGAIPQDTSCSTRLKYGVLRHGPLNFSLFKFEDDAHVRPVSAILSITPMPEVEFNKPIELIMPIYIDCENEEDCQRLAIFKACIIDSATGEEGIYKMSKVEDAELTLLTDRKTRIQFVKISVKHCCCYCVGEYFKEDTNKAKFCLVEAIPNSQLSQSELTIEYCLPYYLPTCIKTIEEQYPDSDFKLTMRAVRFSDDSDSSDPAIHIKFQENLDTGHGWKFMLKDGINKIYRKDVCFWDIPSCKELVFMCANKTYPPRFTVMINGRRATKDIQTLVMFPGSMMIQGRAECQFTVSLNCEHQPRMRHITSGDSVLVTPSDQVHTECAREALRTKLSDIAEKVDPLRLALKLFSYRVIERDILDKAKDRKEDRAYRNLDVLDAVSDSLKDHPGHFTLLCEALNDISPEIKLSVEYKNSCHCSRSASIARRRSYGSVSTASMKSAQESFSIEQDEDHVNGLIDEEQPSLVAGLMNGAAILPHGPMPFPIVSYGPGAQNLSNEEMTQTVNPIEEGQ